LKVEEKIVDYLIKTLAEKGWVLKFVDDGGADNVYPKDHEDALDAVFAVEEAHLYFERECFGKVHRHWVHYVMGNGTECLVNHTCNATDDFERILDEFVYPFCDSLT
jgi:hypothetical protein